MNFGHIRTRIVLHFGLLFILGTLVTGCSFGGEFPIQVPQTTTQPSEGEPSPTPTPTATVTPTTTPVELTVSIAQGATQADPTGTLPVVFTVSFNRAIDPASFSIADITQTGTATGVIWSLTTSNNTDFNLSATAVSGEGTLKPTIAAGAVQDSSGTSNKASTASDNTVTYQVALGAFSITGITGGSDTTADNSLASGLIPTVVWDAAANAHNYDVTVYANDGSTVVCPTVNTTSTSYNFSTCTLSYSSAYKARVIAKRTSGVTIAAINNLYSFTTVAPLTVAVAQGAAQADPTGILPVTFTVTFSRAIDASSFTTADITQAGTATGVVWSLSSANNITFTLNATALTGEGTLVPVIAAAVVQDPLGNLNTTSTATDNSVTYQGAPAAFNITGISGGLDATVDNALASGLIPTVHWSAAANTNSYDVSVFANDGSTVVCPTVNTTSTSYGFSGCTLAYSSTYKVAVVAKRTSGASTTAGNNFYAFTTPTPLTVAVAQGGAQTDPAGTLPVTFMVTFSRAIDAATFTAADITQAGTATGVMWSLSSANNITFTLNATAATSEGTLVPTIAAGVVLDTLGNPNAVSTASDNSVTYQILPGSFSVSGITGGSDTTVDNTLTSGLVPTVTWGSSANAQSYDVTVYASNGTTVVCPTVNTTSTSYNFSACTLAYSSIYKMAVVAKRTSGVTIAATNNLYSFTMPTPLTVAVAQAGGQVDPAGSLPVSFTVTFSRAIAPASFTIADITQSGTATGVTWSLSSADNITYSLNATAVTGEGTLVPAIAAGVVQDLFANSNAASTAIDSSVTYQAPPAAFSITGITGGADITANNTLTSGLVPTVNWNAATNANSYDVTVYANNGTTVVCPTVNTTSTSYNFSSCTLSYGTTYKAAVVAKRSSGGTTTATNNLYSFTTVAGLTVAIAQGGAQADPTGIVPITFTVTFNRAIEPTSFTNSDITQSGTATGVTWSLTTSDNITYTLNATAVTGEGTVVPTIAASAVQDPAGYPNGASTASDNSVTYQSAPAAFSITGITGGADTTANNTLTSGLVPTVNWNAATNANSYDVTVYANNGTTVVCPTVNTTATSYNFSTCTLSYGTTYKAGVIAKRSSGGTTTATNNLYSFTTVAGLTVAIAQGGAQADPTGIVPISFTVTFNRAIAPATFTTADITQGGTATGVTWSLTTSDYITYTLNATAVSGEGTVVPTIAASAVQDPAGYPNGASTAVDNSVTFQAGPGAFSITGITGGADTTANNALTSGLVPTVNWAAAANGNSYDVTIYANNGTTVVCPTVNTTSTSYNFSSCTLSYGSTYKAGVIAKRSSGGTTAAGNNLYSFTTVAALTVVVAQGGSQVDPTVSLPVAFTVTFNRAIAPATFTTADITQGGTATGVTWSLTTSNSITYTLSATAVTGEGTLVPSIAASAVQDPAGYPNAVSTATDNSVTYQTTSSPTVADIVASQTATSHEAAIPDIRFEWQRYPMIIMQSPAKADIPDWFPYTKPNWCTILNAWMQVFEAEGNTATNTRVEYRNLRIYILSQSTRTWSLLKNDLKPEYTDTWKYPFDFASDGGDRPEPSGGVSFKAKYPLFAHGYGGQLTITPEDVRAVFVTMDTRLILDNASGTDDRASARYLVNVGADYWPDVPSINNAWPYAPGVGQGRFILATPQWRKATMIIPNGRYGSSMQEMIDTYPPPLN